MDVTIERLAYGGDGVAREQPVVFVPRTAPGDRARVEVTETKPRFRRARVLEILEPGADRVTPPCPHYLRGCGGCQLQHLSYDAQALAKEEWVRDALKRIGGLDARVSPIVKSPRSLGYRNKATFHWSPRDKRFALIAADGVTPVPVGDCPLLIAPADRVFRAAAEIAAEIASDAFAELIVRAGEQTGETMAALVVRAKTDDANRFAEALAARANPTSIVTRTEKTSDVFSRGEARHGEKTSDVFSDLEPPDDEDAREKPARWHVLHGASEIRERIGDVRFVLDADTFLQVNTQQAAKLFALARDGARLTGGERVLDLFCGNGGIALSVAGRAKNVLGIETVATAVDRGRRSATENGIENVRFRRGRVESTLKKLHHSERVKPDVVFLDPPRAGAKPVVLDTLARMAPKRIVYVSCNPTTLARDLKTLAAKGYAPRDVVPVDLFPQTYHVECVAVLEAR